MHVRGPRCSDSDVVAGWASERVIAEIIAGILAALAGIFAGGLAPREQAGDIAGVAGGGAPG